MASFRFDPKSIAITFITCYPKWYRGKVRSIKHTDKIRGDSALESIKVATKHGYQIILVDGKSSKSFRETLRQIPKINVKFLRTPKRSPKRRQSFKIASKLPGVKVIVISEPEKISLITDCLTQIAKPLLANEADIIVPKRQDDLFKTTYPKHQYESEQEGNDLYNQYLKSQGLLPPKDEKLDFFFGPRAFRNEPKILALFMRKFHLAIGNDFLPENYYNPEEYSNSLYFPILLALKKKTKKWAHESFFWKSAVPKGLACFWI